MAITAFIPLLPLQVRAHNVGGSQAIFSSSMMSGGFVRVYATSSVCVNSGSWALVTVGASTVWVRSCGGGRE